MNKEIKSYVNFELKITLTVLDNLPSSNRCIDLLYTRDRNRISDDLLAAMKKSKKSVMDTVPNVYIHDLYEYQHFFISNAPLMRVGYKYSQFIESNAKYCWVTEEQFPKKPVGTFQDYCEFVIECNASNLMTELVPIHSLNPNALYYGEEEFFRKMRADYTPAVDLSYTYPCDKEVVERLNNHYLWT